MSSIDPASKIDSQFITFIVATAVAPLTMHFTLAQENSDEELVKEGFTSRTG
jgi:hypothetical protein